MKSALLTLIALVVAALFVAGCGDSEAEAQQQQQDTQEQLEQVSQDPASGAANPEASDAEDYGP